MKGPTRLLESSPTRPVRRMPFWLIARHDLGRLEALTTEFSDGRREEEARLFLRLGTHSGWRVRATGLGELVSVLYGPCREVELVALDPLPQREAETVNSLLCVNRERFVGFLRKGSDH